MPCAASTTAGEAAAASTVTAEMPISPNKQRETLDQKPLTPTLFPQAGRERDPRSGRVRGSALADRLVEPLVIQRPFERIQFLPEFLGVRGGNARVEGLAVAPGLKQREVIRAGVVLLEDVE